MAIRGEIHDGHSFIPQVIENGALGIICKKGTPKPTSSTVHFYEVEDTQEKFRQMAANWRNQYHCPVIAIGGAVGKTTTKEFLTSLLKGKWNDVLKTEGSQNGYLGIPMTLLQMRAHHQAAVIEIGIDEIGAMQKHLDIVKPTHSFLTAIGPEHLEFLKNIQTVAKEEGVALEWTAKNGGSIAVNLDDPWIAPHQSLKAKSVFTYSMNDEAQFRGKYNPEARTIEIRSDTQSVQLRVPLAGAHNAQNLLAATTMAFLLRLNAQEIQTGLKKFEGAEGRSQIRKLKNQVHVICDYYNASPPSMAAGLDLLFSQYEMHQNKVESPINQGRLFACLADMRELGTDEKTYHRNLASQILTLPFHGLYLFGPLMRELEDELRNKNFRGQLVHFSSTDDLFEHLSTEIRSQDWILIKGSRSMKMETVWKKLEFRFGIATE